MENNQEKELNKAYDVLNKKVLSSNMYYKFITSIADLNEFRDIFSYNGKFNTDKALESLKNLENLRYICNNETGLKKENEFHNMIINCVSNEDAITTIVNTFLMETKYGNPKRENLDDYTLNDRMFYILQSIFGLDTLIESVINKEVLFHKFCEITKDYNEKEVENFISLIDEIYKEAKMLNDPNEIKNYIVSRKEDLKQYIYENEIADLDKISNSEHGSFQKHDELKEIVDEILDNSKKM